MNISTCGTPIASPSPFRQFMRGLSADARLGRYIRPIADQSPECIVLHLVRALADADEGNRPHPAFALLDELDAREVAR